jgi:toxin YoeB
MRIIFTDEAWESYLYWHRHDKKIFKKINDLIKELKRMPFEGLGKPEPLKHELAGCWSRRITPEHRIVYKIVENNLVIISTRYHYD